MNLAQLRSKGTYVWVDVSPYGRTNGGPVNVYRDHYWRIRPNDNGEPRALCWRYRGITAPQANTNRTIVEQMAARDGQGGDITLLPFAFLPHRCDR